MAVTIRRLAFVAAGCLLLCSCGKDEGFRKETFPATGEVYVDGQPAGQLKVECHNLAGIDKENPTFSQAFTDENGKFEIATYEAADGLPEGEYVLTFMWGELDLISGGYGGPDKLNGRYTDPQTSEHRFKVEAGKPTDLGKIELTTN
jgi:hypothetical protein